MTFESQCHSWSDTDPFCFVSKGLLRNALEHLLDGSRVADEAHRHLQALRRDVANAAPGSSIQFLLNFGSIRTLSYRLSDTRNKRND